MFFFLRDCTLNFSHHYKASPRAGLRRSQEVLNVFYMFYTFCMSHTWERQRMLRITLQWMLPAGHQNVSISGVCVWIPNDFIVHCKFVLGSCASIRQQQQRHGQKMCGERRVGQQSSPGIESWRLCFYSNIHKGYFKSNLSRKSPCIYKIVHLVRRLEKNLLFV